MQEFLLWFLIAIICFIIEIFTFTTFFLLVGLATLMMSAIIYFFPDVNLVYKALIFLVLSISVIFVFYKYSSRKKPKSKELDVNDRMSVYLDRVVVALEDSQNGITKIQLGDTVWRSNE